MWHLKPLKKRLSKYQYAKRCLKMMERESKPRAKAEPVVPLDTFPQLRIGW